MYEFERDKNKYLNETTILQAPSVDSISSANAWYIFRKKKNGQMTELRRLLDGIVSRVAQTLQQLDSLCSSCRFHFYFIFSFFFFFFARLLKRRKKKILSDTIIIEKGYISLLNIFAHNSTNFCLFRTTVLLKRKKSL